MTLDIISRALCTWLLAAIFAASCSIFWALDDEELFIIEGSCQFISIGCCHRQRCVRSRQQQQQLTWGGGSVASQIWLVKLGSQPGVGKGSETGPMMGGLRVALRTLPVEWRLLPESDPRHRCTEDIAVNITFVVWRLCEGLLSQNKVLQRSAEQILDDRAVDIVQQRFVEQNLEAPCVVPVEVWRGSVAPFSGVLQLLDVLALFSRGNLGIVSTSPSTGRHSPSCSRDSLRMLL